MLKVPFDCIMCSTTYANHHIEHSDVEDMTERQHTSSERGQPGELRTLVL